VSPTAPSSPVPVDDDHLEALKDDLIAKRLAVDEDGRAGLDR
jgi:hypothetical protein